MSYFWKYAFLWFMAFDAICLGGFIAFTILDTGGGTMLMIMIFVSPFLGLIRVSAIVSGVNVGQRKGGNALDKPAE